MRHFSISALTAGLIAVLVSYAGPLAIVFQATQAAGIDGPVVASWIWAVAIGSGIAGAWLSWQLKIPVITAWSTPGAALLVTALPGHRWPEAVGAFLAAHLLLAVLAWSGLLERVLRRIPQSLAAALLAGILFRFGTDVAWQLKTETTLVLAIFAAYLLGKRGWPRYAVPLALLGGLVAAGLQGRLSLAAVHLDLVAPVWTTPAFSGAALLGIALPLALVTLTGQYLPGLALLRSAGYPAPVPALVGVPAAVSVLLAPFGGHGVNLAAITAAICTGPEAHADPARRYIAGTVAGVANLVCGLFGATLVALFAVLPKALIGAVAGLALLGAIGNGLVAALKEEQERESALITFLVTASGVSLLGLGAAFWGVVAGLVTHAALHLRRGQPAASGTPPVPGTPAARQG